MTDAIQISGLVKTFGQTRALDGVDLSVRSGEVHGFLGPNGAGKSTTIRVLLGLLRADAGEVAVMGRDPWDAAVALHRRLAYVPGDVNLWPDLTGGEAIDVIARTRGRFNQQKRDELCERFELDPTKKGRAYSKGNRQKVAIVAALASEVDLLILDEPTSGLDPLMENVFQESILEETARGCTVFLSSHILAEVEELCDRVSIIRQGKIVESGSLDQLRHLTRTSITVETAKPASELDRLGSVHGIERENGRVTFQVDSDQIAPVIGYLHSLGIRSLVSQPPTLEQLFLRHYDQQPDEEQLKVAR